MAKIENRIAHASGIPLGGIGTGSVEIRPDGHFHEWQIFNLGSWAPRQPEERNFTGLNPPPGTLAFHVWIRQGDQPPVMRRLGVRMDQENLYSFSWLKSVESISFAGRYPVASLRYHDADLPVAIEATMFSPFIPHDARTSGTPGFYAVFTVKNRTRQRVQVSLLGVLRNFLAWGQTDRRLRNSVASSGRAAFLTLRTDVDGGPDAHPTVGSVCLSVAGGKPTWIAGEFDEFLNGYFVSHWSHPKSTYGMPHESWLHDFRRAGRLPSLDGDRAPLDVLPITEAEIDALSPEACRQAMERLAHYPFVTSLRERVTTCGLKLDTPDAIRTFIKEIFYRLDVLAGPDRKRQDWGHGALCSTMILAPGESREVRFAFSWHFPCHYSAKGPVLGHVYENWFADAEAVNRFLQKGAARFSSQTLRFAETLYDTTLDPVLPDAWSGQLSTLAKCTWWTKAGDFAVWEGLGCCGFHTTDITYQGSFNILALFPELQKQQMEMGARFQREDGRVHHFFTPDLSAVDNGFDRVDMNQQFVLLVVRDYLWTGDRTYLARLWPHIVRAMDNTARLDRNGDGLPDHDTKRNTYDAWDFSGTPAYIASLWLAALRAAIRAADDLGKTTEADAWRSTLDRGTESFDRKLWNGRYYSLWVDGAERDECCMTDQIDGEWFTQLVGLGHCLPREKIVAALRAVFEHNYSDESGLINACYPPGARPRLSTLQNLQATAPWTGIEYAIASMMMDFGMVREGLAVVRNIHERYMRAGRFWNHVECGDHYYRAMSSWAVLLGATGFKIDMPRETLTIAPAYRQARFRAPWVSSTGWGTFVQTGKDIELRCLAGEVRFRRLKLSGPLKNPAASIDGKSLAVVALGEDVPDALEFAKPVRLRVNSVLAIRHAGR